MKRIGAIMLLACVVAGCGPRWTEDQELSYLQSLSNPTPAEWNRRNELTLKLGHAAEKRRLEQEAGRIEAEQKAARDPAQVAAREQAAREAIGARILDFADRAEAAERSQNLASAARSYREAARLAGDTPLGQKYDAKAREIWRVLYGSLPYEE